MLALQVAAQTTILGTYTGATVTGDITIATGTSATLTGNTTFTGANATLNANSGIYWQQIGTLSGKTVTFGNNAYLYVSGTGNALTLGPTTTLTGHISLYTLNTLGTSITNSGAINHTSTGYGYLYAPVFTNSGTITATAGSLELGGFSATYTTFNSGTVTADGASTTLYVKGNVSNTGTLRAQNSGVLWFQGNNTSGLLGTVQLATGGRALIGGNVTNTALAAPTGGAFELFGGTITGGTVAAGALTFTSSGGTLTNVSLTSDLSLPASSSVILTGGSTTFTGANATFGNNSSVYWQQSATLGGKALAFGSGSYLYLYTSAAALTLGATSSATGSVSIYSDGAPSTAFTNQGAITHTAGTGFIYASTFTNSGTITATGGTLNLGVGYGGHTTVNTGTITADGATTTVNLRDNFTNSGILRAINAGQLIFTGTNTSGNLGTVQITTGGRALIGGALTNTALAAPTGGAFELYGGTITGGTIAAGALTFTSSGGTIDGATITGNIALGSGEYVTLKNSAGFTGTGTINSGTLYLSTDLTALANSAYIFTGAGSYLSYTGGPMRTLTLPATTSLTRSGTGYTYVYDNLTNNGTVSVSGGNLQFQSGTTFTNTGTTTVTGSGSTLYLYGLANSGSIAVDTNGVAQLVGAYTTANLGTFALTNGGAVQLSGTLNNASANLAAPSAGTFTLYGGTITGGTINPAALSFSSSGGTLDGATLSGNLSLGSGQTLTLKNSGGFTGTGTINNGTLYLSTDLTALANSAYIFTGAGSYLSYTGGPMRTLTLPATTSLTRSGTGYTYVYDNLTNAGTVSVSGGNLQFQSGTTFTNTGTTTVTGSGSTLYLYGLANSGSIAVNTGGLLQLVGTVTTTNLGTFAIASGGAITLSGTINNASANLAVPSGGTFGFYGGTVTGGTITNGALTFTSSGGTLDGAAWQGDLTLPANTSLTFINNASFTGANATFGTSSTFNWNQTGTLSGKTLTAGSGTTSGYIRIGGGYALTLGGTSALTGIFDLYANSSASFTNLGAITANSGTSYLYGASVTNSGTITAGANASLYLGYYGSDLFTNASGGSVTANGANAKINLQNVVNQGTLSAQNSGVLSFQGTTNTTANLGTVTLASGGRAQLAGTVNNAAATLNAPTGGTFELSGGTINGGTVAVGALTFTSSGGTLSGVNLLGSSLTLPVSSSVTLANSSLNGDVSIGDSASLTLTANTLFPGVNLSLGASSTLNWNQTGTLSGKTLTAGAGTTLGYIRIGSGYALTLGGTSTLSGVFDLYTNTSASFTNYGALTANNGTSYLYGASTINSGTILANSGASLYLGYYGTDVTTNTSGGNVTVSGLNSRLYLQNIVNQGSVSAQNNGALYFQGTANTTATLGSVTLSGGGHAYISGTVDNSSATLKAPSGGVFELSGGTINGGNIAAGALAFTSNTGTVSGANFLGNVTLANNAYAYIAGGTTFSGAAITLGTSAYLYWQQSGTLSGQTVTLAPSAAIYLSGINRTLTLAANTTLTGNTNVYADGSPGSTITNLGAITNSNSSTGSLYARTFTNSGNITATAGTLYLGASSIGYTFANTAGATITANGGNIIIQAPAGNPVVNQGTINVQSGTLYTSNLLTNGATGTITGAGTINGNLAFTGGTLAPGNNGTGTLSLLGNLTLGSGANTIFELNGSNSDRITGINTLTLGGQFTLYALSTAFSSGQTWNLFGASTITGNFSSFNLPYTNSGWVWDTSQLATTGTLVLTTFVPVPEPSTYLLLAAGLGAIFAFSRRRRLL